MSRRPNPRGPLLLSGLGVLAVGFTTGAVHSILEGVREGDPSLVWGMAMTIAPLSVVLWLTLLGNVLQHLFPRGLPAPRLSSWDGVEAVEIPEWSYGARVAPILIVVGAVVGLLLGAGALVGGQPLFGGVGVASGVVGCYLLLQLVRGRLSFRGGVWLTPAGLTYRQGPEVSVLAWDDVLDVRPRVFGGGSAGAEPDELTVHAVGNTVRRTTRGRRAATRMAGHVTIDTRWLGVPAEGLAEVVRLFSADPRVREELGREAGLRRVLDHAHGVVRSRAS